MKRCGAAGTLTEELTFPPTVFWVAKEFLPAGRTDLFSNSHTNYLRACPLRSKKQA